MLSAVSKITKIYVLILFAVFPLFMTDKYYDIQNDKMYFFLYLTIACLAALAVTVICGLIKGDREEGLKEFTVYVRSSFKLPGIFAATFLITVVISTICSEWLYEAFWGNMGRFMGCFMWIFYIAGFLIITLFYRPERWHMDLFLMAGMIVSLWGILDYFYLSPFGWQQGSIPYEALDFSSTIGNINLLTSVEAIYLAAASVMFMGNDGRGVKAIVRGAFYYLTALAAFMGLIAGFSDNAVIAVAAAICFLPFYAFRSGKGIVKYIGLVTGYLFTMVLIHRLSVGFYTAGDLRYQHRGMLLTLSCEHPDLVFKLFILSAAVLIISAFLLFMFKKGQKTAASGFWGRTGGEAEAKYTEGGTNAKGDRVCWKGAKPLRIIWAALGVLAAAFIIYVFYDANTGGHPEVYGAFSEWLILDADWGTNRGFNWGLALSYIRDFPIFKLLFGSGPETYSIYTLSYDYHNMVHAFDEIYDSPHNEWLQMFFTTGILGCIGYYGMYISSMVKGFKASAVKRGNDPMGAAFAYGVLIFILVSFVNISTPINVPMALICAAAAAAYGREKAQAK